MNSELLNKEEISKDEIHFYIIELDNLKPELPEIKSALSKSELETANKFKFNKDRERFIITRYLLRKILSNYLYIPPKEIQIITNQYGKPKLDSELNNNIQFNVSHSGDFAIFAINLFNEIGVDIEKIDNTINHLEIADNYFSTDEIAYLNASTCQSEIAEKFFRIWTRKESLLKAIGIGLLPDLKKISVIENRFHDNELSPNLKASTNNIWNIETLIMDNFYKVSLAYSGDLKKIIKKI